MAVSNVKADIQCDIRRVWETVLGVENYHTWRSDLSKAEAAGEKQFIEYTGEGYPTTFTVTLVEPYRRWELDMENTNMKGHWVGLFASKDGMTELDFTEYVTAKKLFMRPFVGSFLKKQQARFIADLRRALREGPDGPAGQ